MKKLLLLIISIIAILYIPNVYATDSVKIESITPTLHNAREIHEPDIDGLDIKFDLSFSNPGDNIVYKIVINNPTKDDYEIIEEKYESEYISYDYKFDDENKIIEKNKKTTLNLTINYDNEVPEEKLSSVGLYNENNNIELKLEEYQSKQNEDKQKDNKQVLNPKTGRIIFKTIILIILILGISLTIFVNKRNKKIYLFILSLLLIPTSIYALEKLTINIESKIEINSPFVFSIDDNEYNYTKGMTWQDWVDSEYNTIGAFTQKWYYEKQITSDNYLNYYFRDGNTGIITSCNRIGQEKFCNPIVNDEGHDWTFVVDKIQKNKQYHIYNYQE